MKAAERRLSQISKTSLFISHLSALARTTYSSHQNTKWPFSLFPALPVNPFPNFSDFPVPITCLKENYSTSHQTNTDQHVVQLSFKHRNSHVSTQITLSPGLLLVDSWCAQQPVDFAPSAAHCVKKRHLPHRGWILLRVNEATRRSLKSPPMDQGRQHTPLILVHTQTSETISASPWSS